MNRFRLVAAGLSTLPIYREKRRRINAPVFDHVFHEDNVGDAQKAPASEVTTEKDDVDPDERANALSETQYRSIVRG